MEKHIRIIAKDLGGKVLDSLGEFVDLHGDLVEERSEARKGVAGLMTRDSVTEMTSRGFYGNCWSLVI